MPKRPPAASEDDLPAKKRPAASAAKDDLPAKKRLATSAAKDDLPAKSNIIEGTFKERLQKFREYAVDKTPMELQDSLKTYFTEVEMSGWWNRLSRDRKNDKSFAGTMDKYVESSDTTTTQAKRSVLALRIRDPTTFKQMLAEQTIAITATDEERCGGSWKSRGALIKLLGEEETTRKIERGKWQVQYDSDEDSEYWLPYHQSSRAVQKKESTAITHRAEGSSEDFRALKKALEVKHTELLAKNFKHHQPSSSSRVETPRPAQLPNAETDEERVARLLAERDEAQKKEREDKKKERELARKNAPLEERVVEEAVEVEKLLGQHLAKMVVSIKKLKKIPHAQSLHQSCEGLVAKMQSKQKDIQKELKKASPVTASLQKLITEAKKLNEEKTSSMDKPVRAFLAVKK